MKICDKTLKQKWVVSPTFLIYLMEFDLYHLLPLASQLIKRTLFKFKKWRNSDFSQAHIMISKP
jgi:hypothetical protein